MSTSSRDGGAAPFGKDAIILRRLPMQEGRDGDMPTKQPAHAISRIDLYFKSVDDGSLRQEAFLPGHAPTVITGDAFVMGLHANGDSTKLLSLKSGDGAPLTLVWGLNENDNWECIVIGDATETHENGPQSLEGMLHGAFGSTSEKPRPFDVQQQEELRTWLRGLGISVSSHTD